MYWLLAGCLAWVEMKVVISSSLVLGKRVSALVLGRYEISRRLAHRTSSLGFVSDGEVGMSYVEEI